MNILNKPHVKGKYKVHQESRNKKRIALTTKMKKPPDERQKSTEKINEDLSTFMEVHVNQKRVNVHEQMVKMVSRLPCLHVHSPSPD